MRSRNAARIRDLPMPASPRAARLGPRRRSHRASGRSSSATSCSRPTRGVIPADRDASKRLTFSTSRRTVQAGTGASKPLSACGPSVFSSKVPPSSRRVASATTTLPGSARACNRAAKLGVSPTTPRSCAVALSDRDRRRRRGRSRCRCGPSRDAFVARVELAATRYDIQAGPYRPFGVVLMGARDSRNRPAPRRP